MRQQPSNKSERFDEIDLDFPEESSKRLSELLEESRKSESRDATLQVELLSQLARTSGLQGKFPEARTFLREAEVLPADSGTPCRAVAKIRYLLELGRLLIAERTPSQSRPLFMEALTLASNGGEDFYAIEALTLLAVVDPPKMKREWTLKALALCESSPQANAKTWLGPLLTALGWLDFEVRQYEVALEHFRRALSVVKADESPRRSIVAKWTVARTLRALGRAEEALDIQKDLVANLNHLNVRDGYVYEELAECLHHLKRVTEALPYFDMAYSVLSKDEWFVDNNPARLKRIKELGKVK